MLGLSLFDDISGNYLVTNGEPLIAVINKDSPRWLDAKKHEFNWEHWNAYKKLLVSQGRNEEIIKGNEEAIDTILDYTGDPRTNGSWSRKGLVMGNVQSGKTQNYLGLINKALDVGYKTIIVLGGHLNDLRMQTQERIDEGVIGRQSRHIIETSIQQYGPIGVGKYHQTKITPATTTKGDFTKSFADRFAVNLTQEEPVIFTIKKHSPVIEALSDWIRDEHFLKHKNKLDQPMLLIDDEADYASINTKSHKKEVTTTNNLIRNLLSLFSKSTYVAYTATPFANIFIDPNDNCYSENDDLFPSDFMIKLPVPDKYLGQDFFFGHEALNAETNKKAPIIEINDHEPIYELKTKSERNYELPESLRDAIRSFMIVTAVRYIRGEKNCHNTMLVNITHLAKHQNYLEILIKEYKDELTYNLSSFGHLKQSDAKKNHIISDLFSTYTDKFDIEESFDKILEVLSGNTRRNIEVWALNQSGRVKERHELNYSTYKEYGLNVIIIGGHKLSRGLTLEGLSISYFARNSKAYDTLMQMCRWFGYRPTYKDLLKVYLPEESITWYSFISGVIKELYSELEIMASRGERPKDFGLKVREHPGAMLVSAKNKIGWGESEKIHQQLWGQTQRRFKFPLDPDTNSNNIEYTKKFIEKLSTNQKKIASSEPILFSDVSYDRIIEFIENIDLPEDDLGNKALINQLKKMKTANLPLPKVLLYNQKSSRTKGWVSELNENDSKFVKSKYKISNYEISLPTRQMESCGGVYRVRSTHLGNFTDERFFLTEDQQKIVKNQIKSPVDYHYISSQDRDFVGLKIYLFAVCLKREQGDTSTPKLIHGREATIGYTISFPRPDSFRDKSKRELNELVKNTRLSYTINKIYQQNLDLMAYEDTDEYDE